MDADTPTEAEIIDSWKEKVVDLERQLMLAKDELTLVKYDLGKAENTIAQMLADAKQAMYDGKAETVLMAERALKSLEDLSSALLIVEQEYHR